MGGLLYIGVCTYFIAIARLQSTHLIRIGTEQISDDTMCNIYYQRRACIRIYRIFKSGNRMQSQFDSPPQLFSPKLLSNSVKGINSLLGAETMQLKLALVLCKCGVYIITLYAAGRIIPRMRGIYFLPRRHNNKGNNSFQRKYIYIIECALQSWLRATELKGNLNFAAAWVRMRCVFQQLLDGFPSWILNLLALNCSVYASRVAAHRNENALCILQN